MVSTIIIHYSNDKIKPGISKEYFDSLLSQTETGLTGEAFDVIFNRISFLV